VPHLIWSLASLADVQRLYCFLATTKLDAAQHAVKAISDEVTLLAHQPSIAPLKTSRVNSGNGSSISAAAAKSPATTWTTEPSPSCLYGTGKRSASDASAHLKLRQMAFSRLPAVRCGWALVCAPASG